MTHICVSKLTIIGSDNGLSPGRRQAIIWTDAGILLIGPLGTNVSEIFIEINTFPLKKMHLKMSSVKGRPSCLGLNVLTHWDIVTHICIRESQYHYFASGDHVQPARPQFELKTRARFLYRILKLKKFYFQVTWPFSDYTPNDLEAKSLGGIPSDFGCWLEISWGTLTSLFVFCIFWN